MEKNRLLAFLLLTLVLACSKKADQKPSLKKLTLIQIDEINLPLDDETTANNPFYQLLETDTATLLSFFNPLNYSLYLYDLDTESLVHKIRFERSGPHGIGERVTSFNIMNKDSIFIHSYYSRKIFFTNWKAEVLGAVKLYNEAFNIYPQTGMGFGPIMVNGRIYINSGVSCVSEEPSTVYGMISVDLSDTTLQNILPFSQNYRIEKRGYWPRKLCDIYSNYNEHKKLLMYSFPLDENVTVIDESGKIGTYEMNTPSFKKKKSLSPGQYPKDPFAEFKAFLSYPRYGNIHYDPYRKLYLRSFYKATPRELLDEDRLQSEKSVVIADENFNIMGEAQFTGTDHVVFTKKGLHQILYNNTMEDTLQIKVFSYGF